MCSPDKHSKRWNLFCAKDEIIIQPLLAFIQLWHTVCEQHTAGGGSTAESVQAGASCQIMDAINRTFSLLEEITSLYVKL